MTDIILHLGLHKTGTTFVQESLKVSRRALIEQGLFYTPLNQMRNKITKNIGNEYDEKKSQDLQTSIDIIASEAKNAGCHTMLLSDENILGFPSQITKKIYTAYYTDI